MPEKAKVPEIRFKGFIDAWKERGLGTIFIYEQPTKYIVDSTEYSDDYETPVLTAGKSFILGYTNELTNIYNAKKRSPVVIFDDFTTASHYVDFPFKVKSSAMKLLKLKQNNDDFYYMYNVLKNIYYTPESHERHWISEFSNFNVRYARTSEQNKIGNFFKHLDDFVILHQGKLEKLQNIKKTLLEKMFPQKGSCVPELRFAGFTNGWEQRKLLDTVLKVVDFRGRTPKKLGLDWSETGYLALSALNVKKGYIDESIDAHYGSQELYDAWMTGNELHQGQVLFTTEAPMGNVAQVPSNKGYILSQRTVAFKIDEKDITEIYLATVLSSPNIFNRLTELSSGGTAKGVSQKTLSELFIPIPGSVKEQCKIGKFFKKLDDTITLHQRKIEKLKNIKKACLDKMFV